MEKYSNKKRFAALNEAMSDGLTIEDRKEGNNVFTILTQWFRAKTIEDAADYMIHYKKFLEMYGYDRQDLFFDMQAKNLSSQRFKVWFDENRKLTEKEENNAIEKDKVVDAFWNKINEEFNKEFAKKEAEEFFGALEIDNKDEIKIRKWGENNATS